MDSPAAAAEEACRRIHSHSRVQLRHLMSRPDLNGAYGVALKYAEKEARWHVVLTTGESFRIRAENLQLLTLPEPSPREKLACPPSPHQGSPRAEAEDDAKAEAPPCAPPKRPAQIVVMGGCNWICPTCTGEAFDPVARTWEELPAMYRPRFQCASAQAEGRLYVIGGHAGGEVVNSVERHTLGCSSWELMPPMSKPRIFAMSAVFDGHIYVCGGCITGEVALSSCERFDPHSRMWQPVPSMRHRRAFGCLVPVAGTLYTFCGFDYAALGYMECYRPTLRWWDELQAGEPRFFATPAVRGSQIFVVGGARSSWLDFSGVGGPCSPEAYRSASSIRCLAPGTDAAQAVRLAECFDTDAKVWAQLPPMLRARCSPVAAFMDCGRLLVCSGMGGGMTVECLDPNKTYWEEANPMLGSQSPSFPMSTISDGYLYVIGGKTANGIALNFAQRLDLATGEWEMLPPMHSSRVGGIAAAMPAMP